MSESIYVVTGATGHIGKVLAETLLKAGHKVRVIGRSQDKLKSLVDKGAEAHVGSLEDSAFVSDVFRGANAVFAMIPPNYAATDYRKFQNELADSLIAAIENSGVTHVVALSSLGAHLPEGTGPIKGLHDFEQKLDRLSDVNVLFLRPTFFFENLLTGIPTIKATGVNGSALKGDMAIPMIATRDIAAHAARAMEDDSFTGKKVQELLGPADVTMNEATTVLGKAIGKEDLQYVQFPYDAVKQAMLGMGLTENMVDELIEMDRTMNEEGGFGSITRTPENTTPTTINDFALIFAAAFNAETQAARP